jgi:hypothetical protein
MLVGTQNRPFEIAFESQAVYGDIFQEVDLDVVFSGEDGETWRVPAFWSGQGSFRVRFAAPRAGLYHWTSECTNPSDAGLHGRRGDLRILPKEGPSPLFRHGRLRVSSSGRTLEHADGTPFLWLADTWWMGMTSRLDWPDGFRRLVADRVQKGFNAVQIVVGPLPDFNATTSTWDPQQANDAGWPWEEGFKRINPSYFDHADLKIAYMVEQGLLPCIVGMWGYYLPFMGLDRCRRHWRYLVARYGAYPVAWCLAGECTMPTYEHHGTDEYERDRKMQVDGWTEIARDLRALDPFHNPATIHPTCETSGRLSLLDGSLVDFDMLQTGHSSYLSLLPSLEALRNATDCAPRIPVLNAEVNYEGILGGSKDEVQRYLFWANLLEGACGFTYGAQGIWAMNDRNAPYHGSTGSWGDGFWQDAMHAPGSGHVGLGARILRTFPWWRLRPSEETAAVSEGHSFSLVGRIPGELVVAYLPCNCLPLDALGNQRNWGRPFPIRIESDASYTATYLNPRTGERIPIGEVVAEKGSWQPPVKPTMEDWVLMMEGLR